MYYWQAGEEAIYVLTSGDILSKLDSSGIIIWTKDVSATICGQTSGIRAITLNGDRLFLYWRYSVNNDALIVLDTSGALVNSWCDYTWWADYEMTALYPRMDGGVWAFYTEGPGNGNYAIVTQYGHNGDQDTTAPIFQYNICFDDYIEDEIPFTDSTYLLVNNGTDYTAIFNSDCGIFKVNKDGNVIYQRIFGMGDTLYNIARAGVDSSNNIYLILFYIDNLYSGYKSMKLDPAMNIISCNTWNASPVVLSMDHYDRMQYKDGYLYCPAVYWASSRYQAILCLDTLLSPFCGVTMTQSGVGERVSWASYTQWYAVTPEVFTTGNANFTVSQSTLPVTNNYCSAVLQTEEYSEPVIEVSPNPTNGIILIELNDEENNSLVVINSQGLEMVYLKNISSRKRIDLSALPDGLYFLLFQSSATSILRKIIKLSD